MSGFCAPSCRKEGRSCLNLSSNVATGWDRISCRKMKGTTRPRRASASQRAKPRNMLVRMMPAGLGLAGHGLDAVTEDDDRCRRRGRWRRGRRRRQPRLPDGGGGEGVELADMPSSFSLCGPVGVGQRKSAGVGGAAVLSGARRALPGCRSQASSVKMYACRNWISSSKAVMTMAITNETAGVARSADAVQQVPGRDAEHHDQHVAGEHVGEEPHRERERPDEDVRDELDAARSAGHGAEQARRSHTRFLTAAEEAVRLERQVHVRDADERRERRPGRR